MTIKNDQSELAPLKTGVLVYDFHALLNPDSHLGSIKVNGYKQENLSDFIVASKNTPAYDKNLEICRQFKPIGQLLIHQLIEESPRDKLIDFCEENIDADYYQDLVDENGKEMSLDQIFPDELIIQDMFDAVVTANRRVSGLLGDYIMRLSRPS